MRGIGVREWVALGALGLALFLAFCFSIPVHRATAVTRPPGRSLSASHQPAPPHWTATPEPTATPLPPKNLAQPEGTWFVTYFEKSKSGRGTADRRRYAASLAFDIPGRPFPDVADDAWRIEARLGAPLEPGRYQLSLEVDGGLKVTVDGVLVHESADTSSRRTETVAFEHGSGSVNILISLEDSGGPAFLKWR